MLKVAVVDDESDFLDYVYELVNDEIKKYCKSFIVKKYVSGEELLNRHRVNPFDVVFLDIDMPNITGFNIATELREQSNDCYIVFITNHSELVYDSLNFQPFNFVPKENLEQFQLKLSGVIKKLTRHLKQHQKIVLYDKKQGRFSVSYNDILYIQSEDHYVRFYILGVKPKKTFQVVVRSSIGDVEKKFAEYDFVRIHKKYLVNLAHIFNIDMKNDLCIFKQNFNLPVSRNLKHSVDEKFTEFLKKTI